MAVDLLLGRSPRDFSRGSSVGDEPLVWTRSAVKAELDRVRNVLDTVNTEMSQAVSEKKLSPEEWKRWRAIYDTAHKFVSNASPSWGSNVATARNHEAEAIKWHDLVLSRGATALGPKLEKSSSGLGLNFPTALLAVGGVLAVGYLVKSVHPFIRKK